MIYTYPVIDGIESPRWIKTEWEEIDCVEFLAWSKLNKQLEKLQAKHKIKADEIRSVLEKSLIAKRNGKEAIARKADKILAKLKRELLPINNEIKIAEAECISIFSSLTPVELCSMNDSSSSSIDNMSDNDMNVYRQYLGILTSKEIPHKEVSSFYFQTATDDEIAEVKAQLNAVPNEDKEGVKKLKSKLYKMTKSEYKIKNIWQQSTFANKDFMQAANDIVERMAVDDFSGLIELIALCSVETDEENNSLEKIKNEKSVKAYIENYNKEFTKIYNRRVRIFSEQKEKLKLTVAIGVRDFFLANLKT